MQVQLQDMSVRCPECGSVHVARGAAIVQLHEPMAPGTLSPAVEVSAARCQECGAAAAGVA